MIGTGRIKMGEITSGGATRAMSIGEIKVPVIPIGKTAE
jgi:hypothetical protein